MMEYIIAIDLGTTNIKAGIYDSHLKEIAVDSTKVDYINIEEFVEFNPEQYWNWCKNTVKSVIVKSGINPKDVLSISLQIYFCR